MELQQTYNYDELTSKGYIRIVRILPGNAADLLHCEILAVDLYNDPEYEAISYVWGSDERSAPLIVRTPYGNRLLPITRNLYGVLRAFREAHSSLDLWADGICINQNSVSEKNDQVQLMGDIYRRASQVRVWLAYPNEMTQETRKCVMDIVAMAFKDETRAHYNPYETVSEADSISQHPALADYAIPGLDEVHAAFELPSLETPEFQRAIDLLQNPWFSRAWTWQENFLARKRTFYIQPYVFHELFITHLCLGLSYLNTVTGDERYTPADNADWNFSVTADSHEKQYGSAAYNLGTLIPMQRGKGCKEAHDLIYSALGVAQDHSQIEVDYRIPVELVFAKTAWEIMQHEESLSLLCHVLEDQASSGLPSWTPDWRMDSQRTKFPIEPWFTDSYKYKATGSSRPWGSLSNHTKTLTLRGVQLDAIWKLDDHTDWADFASDIEDEYGVGPYPFTQEPFYRAVLRTWFLDITRYKDERPVTRWQPGSGEEIDEIVFRARATPTGALNYVKLTRGVVACIFDRLMLVTKTGMIGVCPKKTQESDVVALLLGGSVPYILRPTGTLDQYQFIGECYIHGFMDGEGLSKAWRAAHPSGELVDTSWLDDLHDGDVPFDTKEFHLV